MGSGLPPSPRLQRTGRRDDGFFYAEDFNFLPPSLREGVRGRVYGV